MIAGAAAATTTLKEHLMFPNRLIIMLISINTINGSILSDPMKYQNSHNHGSLYLISRDALSEKMVLVKLKAGKC